MISNNEVSLVGNAAATPGNAISTLTQATRRRERQRIDATNTRLRKKIKIEGLQKEIMDLQREHNALKMIVLSNLDKNVADEILKDSNIELPSVVMENYDTEDAADLDRQDFSLVELINSQGIVVAPVDVHHQLVLHNQPTLTTPTIERDILGREQMLKELGFDSQYINDAWMKQFHALAASQTAYGHIPEGPLEEWVNIQKQHRNQRALTEYQEKLLDDLGVFGDPILITDPQLPKIQEESKNAVVEESNQVFCAENQDSNKETKDTTEENSPPPIAQLTEGKITETKYWVWRNDVCVRHGSTLQKCSFPRGCNRNSSSQADDNSSTASCAEMYNNNNNNANKENGKYPVNCVKDQKEKALISDTVTGRCLEDNPNSDVAKMCFDIEDVPITQEGGTIASRQDDWPTSLHRTNDVLFVSTSICGWADVDDTAWNQLTSHLHQDAKKDMEDQIQSTELSETNNNLKVSIKSPALFVKDQTENALADAETLTIRHRKDNSGFFLHNNGKDSIEFCRKKKITSKSDRKKMIENDLPLSKRNVRTCAFSDCGSNARRDGVCARHGATLPTCKFPAGCSNLVVNNNLCRRHGATKKRRTTCSIPRCPKQAKTGGVCTYHGSPTKKCSYKECTNIVVKGGVCRRHGAYIIKKK